MAETSRTSRVCLRCKAANSRTSGRRSGRKSEEVENCKAPPAQAAEGAWGLLKGDRRRQLSERQAPGSEWQGCEGVD